jgi:branched-chain amino acid transport system ATP-binding protein
MAAAVPSPAAAPLLELRDVDAGYGPFRALFGVSLSLGPGAVLALLGSNGSGKTTIARVCSGLIAPTGGQVFFEGEDVTGWRPYRFAQLGVVHAPEGRSVFGSLSVEENRADVPPHARARRRARRARRGVLAVPEAW